MDSYDDMAMRMLDALSQGEHCACNVEGFVQKVNELAEQWGLPGRMAYESD